MKVAKDGTLPASFPVHQGNIIHGDYSYSDHAREKYMSRSTVLTIKGYYEMSWYEYSKIEVSNQNIQLYCLIVKVVKDYFIN